MIPNGLQSQPEKRSLSSTTDSAITLKPPRLFLLRSLKYCYYYYLKSSLKNSFDDNDHQSLSIDSAPKETIIANKTIIERNIKHEPINNCYCCYDHDYYESILSIMNIPSNLLSNLGILLQSCEILPLVMIIYTIRLSIL